MTLKPSALIPEVVEKLRRDWRFPAHSDDTLAMAAAILILDGMHDEIEMLKTKVAELAGEPK